MAAPGKYLDAIIYDMDLNALAVDFHLMEPVLSFWKTWKLIC